MIDTHCHLTHKKYTAPDEIIQRACDVGVQRMVTIGTSLSDSQKVCELVSQSMHVWGAVGVHPLDVSDEGVPSQEALRALAQKPRIEALGETGIDLYHGTADDLANQQESFIRHLVVARELNKAVVIHARNAFEEVEEILEDVFKSGSVRTILHCYTGDFERAQMFIRKYGCMISFAGIVTFAKNVDQIIDAASKVDQNHLLCETDSPYLAPEPHRGQMSEPGYVRYVYERVAQLRSVPLEILEQQVHQNVCNIFRGLA